MSARGEPTPGSGEDPSSGLARLKERLEEIMGRPKATARDAEEAAEAARALADLLRGEERALRLLGTARDAGRDARPSARRSAERPPGGPPFAGLPLHEAARRVLEEGGWPMHVRDLGARIKAGGWRHPRSTKARPDQIQYQLAARLPRHPETFKRFGPNTFGLAVWGESPPRTQAPTPRLGIVSSGEPYDGPSARWLAEHPEAWYDDMVGDDRG